MPTNFDDVIDRRGTSSLKWGKYPPDVLPLWVADMDFQAAEPIRREMNDLVTRGIFGYECEPNNLRETFVEWAFKRYQWKIQESEILFFPGVVTALNLSVRALATDNDGIIIQPPVYPPFFNVASNTDLNLQFNPLIADKYLNYQMDFDGLKKTITSQSRVFILCNPHNPVGRVFHRQELERLAEICLSNNLVLLSDEIHCDLIYEGHNHVPIAALNEEIANRTVTFMAPSKTFNIAGLKCSLAIVKNHEIRKRIEQTRENLVSTPTLLSMTAAKAAYQKCEGWLADLINYLSANRDFLFQFLKKNIPQIQFTPLQGTYLAWLQCSQLDLKPNPYDFFLNKAKVALNDGRMFGPEGEGFVRLNFGCPRSLLKNALDRMKESIDTNQQV